MPNLDNRTLRGYAFCVTGVFPGGTRPDIERKLTALGAQVHSQVRANTSYILIGDKPGATKLNAARRYGTRRVYADQFERLIGGLDFDTYTEGGSLTVQPGYAVLSDFIARQPDAIDYVGPSPASRAKAASDQAKRDKLAQEAVAAAKLLRDKALDAQRERDDLLARIPSYVVKRIDLDADATYNGRNERLVGWDKNGLPVYVQVSVAEQQRAIAARDPKLIGIDRVGRKVYQMEKPAPPPKPPTKEELAALEYERLLGKARAPRRGRG